MIYTVQVTVEVYADTEHEAYRDIKRALTFSGKRSDMTFIDAEVIEAHPEPEGVD